MFVKTNSENLIEMDADFLCAANEFENYGNRLKEIILKYKDIMQYISMYGFVDGLITNNIISIIIEVGKYPDMIENVIDEANKLIENYVKEIDAADNFTY